MNNYIYFHMLLKGGTENGIKRKTEQYNKFTRISLMQLLSKEYDFKQSKVLISIFEPH